MSALVDGRGVAHHGADASIAPVRIRTFHTLDALRGVAAAAVLLFHAAFMYAIAPPAEGQLAVDLFFVMSGFIIAYRYDRDFARGMAVSAFVRLRLVRLYPLFFLGLVLGAVPPLAAFVTGAPNPMGGAMVSSSVSVFSCCPRRWRCRRSPKSIR